MLEKVLAKIQKNPPSQENTKMEASIMLEIEEIESRQNSIWRRQSRELWLSKGDRNFKFFHAFMVIRRKRNFIWAIKNDNGIWLENRPIIDGNFCEKFGKVFESSQLKIPDEFLISFQLRLLMRKISFLLLFLQQKKLGKCYKIISKLLAYRLRKVLYRLISLNHSAFVKERWTAENAIIAQEVINYLHNKKGRKAYFGVNCDMSKVYDRLEWNFIKAVLKANGFDYAFITLVMACIKSVKFQILLNGGPIKTFYPR
ncbi:uncharacterized protein LOC115713745 [Cannabis sativa]|uniref:uncharacterized protein LOC115713745 n=1 Tax=Cannabis sativa TaxID=3483 RepID=UPI0029CA4CAF|nr:uncharacterized protein LOC115713745 [Cannabis sativa]